jgi:hypothetical protein
MKVMGKERVMLTVARVGLSSSSRATFRAFIVVLAWLALWFSVLVATLDQHPARPEARSLAAPAATPRA